MHLAHRDLQACSAALHQLYQECTLQQFPQKLLPLLSELVPVEHASYNDFDQRRGQYVISTHPERPELKDLAPLFDAHFHTHPLFQVYQRCLATPTKVSDRVTLRQFKQTAMYQEVYRRLGTRHQMVFFVHRAGSRRVGLALNRSRLDFSERDRNVMRFLSPHIGRALHQALAASALSDCLTQVGQGLEAMRRAVLLVEPDGTIRWSSDLALAWLREFFPEHRVGSRTLPPRLRHWLQRGEAAATPARPHFSELQLPGPGAARLRVYCGRAGGGGFVLALLREQNHIEPAAAEALDLTEREAQILFWISEAKTNPEIAAILDISPRTIHKHVQHIFAKLGVENRLQAQQLGWELRRV